MNSVEYEKLFKREKQLFYLISMVIPFFIFSVVTYLFIIRSSGSEVILWIGLLVYAYPFCFFLVYRKGTHKFGRKKTAEFYFTKLKFRQAVIRIQFVDKILLYSIIALVILGFFTGIGFQANEKIKDDNTIEYYEHLEKYEEEKEFTERLTDKELSSYLINNVDLMKNDQLRYHIIGILRDDLEKQEISNEEFFEKLDKIKEDVEGKDYHALRTMALAEIESMNSTKIKKEVFNVVESLKPSRFKLDNEFNNNIILYLGIVVSIPGIMVYTVFLFRFSFYRIKDFDFQFARGCFKTVISSLKMDEMDKRQYLINGISHYNKFLKKNLNLKINNLDEIHSEILPISPEKLTEISQQMLEKLEKGNKLDLVNFLNTKIESKKAFPILKTDPISDRLRGLFPFIISAISTIITILAFIISSQSQS